MDTALLILLNVLSVLVLVLANGFFVAVEFAIVRSHLTKLRAPENQNKFGSASALRLVEHLDLSLSATQLGITVASLLLGWWGERIFADYFINIFINFGEAAATYLSHGTATICALLVVTSLHVVIGELAAKSLAIGYPEDTLRVLAPAMFFLTQVFRPAIFILNESARIFLSIFGLKTVSETERVHSPGELSMLISHSTEYGVLDKSEEEMLKGIFGFSETVAREVMTPRTHLVTIPFDSTFNEVLEIVTNSGFSRFPVVSDGVDDVRGIILSRDLLRYVPEYVAGGKRSFDIRRLMRESYFIPGTKPIDDLLNEFKRQKIHMAIVLDEHGGVDGAVTLEDLIEEIVGDIFDESDAPSKNFVIEDDGDIIIDGGLLVADINEKFGLQVPEGDYDTVAGFVFSTLGRMSRPGDKIQLRGPVVISVNDIAVANENKDAADSDNADGALQLTPETHIVVERVVGNRIESIRIHRIFFDEGEPIPLLLVGNDPVSPASESE